MADIKNPTTYKQQREILRSRGCIIQRDQKYSAQGFFKTHHNILASWLKCGTDLRNFCVHFGRLYYRRFTSIPNGIPEIDKTNERSLFAVILVLQKLYKDSAKWNNEVFTSLDSLVNEYKARIQLSCIGFPLEWEIKLKNGGGVNG
ncbi:MAG: hypothetical protein LBR47_06680 [Spirochaetaceae bacterium]|jgi:abortive infection bacteriophage resistance protein|nr:hypothetical protein [Spirochaetaceae bacterium]